MSAILEQHERMVIEHEAWLAVIAELRARGAADIEPGGSDERLHDAIALWGERLAQLRMRDPDPEHAANALAAREAAWERGAECKSVADALDEALVRNFREQAREFARAIGRANSDVALDEAASIAADLANALGDLLVGIAKSEVVSDRCFAVLHHGPGHRSATRCDIRGPHERHEARIMGERVQWDGADSITGYFDEPPEPS